LTEKWNSTRRERQRLREVEHAEQEARVYAATLVTVNRALEQAKASAEAAARAKSEFLANMSHEVRTPMIAILGYADLLRDANVPAEGRSEYVETIRSHSRHLLAVVSDVLDLANIDTGRLELVSDGCSPWEVAEEVVGLLRPRAEEKGLALSLASTGMLPQFIQSDAARLRQILMHVVGNAVKFTDKGSVRVVIGLSKQSQSPDPELEISVTDTGIGIAADDQRKLFESFAQVDSSAARKHGGAGLGLALSRRLLRMLGGDISVESDAGRGSSFTLTIKTGDLTGVTMQQEPKAALPSAPSKAQPASEVRLCGRILLVEDALATQRLYAHVLRRAGAEVVVMDNGRQGVDQALAAMRAGNAFDVMLLDMQLPGLSGYQAASELRAAGYKGVVVAITAHTAAGEREKCLAAGCDRYATKPIEPAALVDLCQSAMSRTAPPSVLPGTKPRSEAPAASPPRA
jgi:signal transduction histidine kinase/ActR/RegA family two-component response regulator